MGAWKGGKDREAQNLPEISVELRSHDQVCVLATWTQSFEIKTL